MVAQDIFDHRIDRSPAFDLRQCPLFQSHQSASDWVRRPLSPRPHVGLPRPPKPLFAPPKAQYERSWRGTPSIPIILLQLAPSPNGVVVEGPSPNPCPALAL